MTNQPETAWVEAAQSAAARAFKALGSMEQLDLGLSLVSEDEAESTNSADGSFLDYLNQGGHLNANFLANACD